MSADELAAIHTGKPAGEPAPEPKIEVQEQLATGPVPTPAKPPIPPPAPPPAPRAAPAAPVSSSAPIPGFLAAYLPSLPDDAQPTGERGDFVTRLLAYLIDIVPLVILWVLILGLQLVLGSILGPGACLVSALIGLLHFVVALGYAWLFLPYCWIKFGASPGKKMMKLRVVPEDNPTGRIDVSTAVLRMVGHLVNGILLGLPYLIILGSERKGLQDLISKSIVIKVDR
jgi:uncharacterized RDD family membrane protein YckC